MVIYLDTCTFNRPFDSQNRPNIKLETEAKIFIQDKIKSGELVLVWSYILEYENNANPFLIRKLLIQRWKNIAKVHILENEDIINRAKLFLKLGLKSKDALHLSCAIEGKAKVFITTDKKILSKSKDIKEIEILNPVNFILNYEEK